MWIAIALLVALPAVSMGEIIDRIAVTVNNRVITESEILRQIRLTAFMNGEKPEFTAESKRRTADRLVEQTLIRREIETSRYLTEAKMSKALYDQIRNRYKDEASYRQALAEYGIGDEDVRNSLEWQATLLDFVSVRFRPGIQIPESDLKDFYDAEMANTPPDKQISFDDARETIEEILEEQRVDNALDRWLGQARTQSRIRLRQEVLQ